MKLSDYPLVSIVTPSFNSELYIEETINSVLSQTYKNIEYIIIDGNSSDKTVSIIEKYKNQISYFVSEPDLGQADAIRKGLLSANGEILAWINSDDLYLPNTVEIIVNAFLRGNCDVVYGNRLIIDHYGNICAERRLTPFLKFFSAQGCLYGGFGIYQPAAFWSKDIYNKVGCINPNMSFCMDNELIAKFVMGMARFKFVDSFLVQFRIHENSKTSNLGHVKSQELKLIADELPEKPLIYKKLVSTICRGYKLFYHVFYNPRYLVTRYFSNNQYKIIP